MSWDDWTAIEQAQARADLAASRRHLRVVPAVDAPGAVADTPQLPDVAVQARAPVEPAAPPVEPSSGVDVVRGIRLWIKDARELLDEEEGEQP